MTAHAHLHKHVLAESSKRYESPYVNIAGDSYRGKLNDLLRHLTRQGTRCRRLILSLETLSAKCPSLGLLHSWGSIFRRYGGRRGTLGKTALTGMIKISPEANHRTCQAACSVGAQAIRFDHHGTQGARHGRAGVFDDERHDKLAAKREENENDRGRTSRVPRPGASCVWRLTRASLSPWTSHEMLAVCAKCSKFEEFEEYYSTHPPPHRYHARILLHIDT